MLKRLANWLFLIAYGESLWSHDESLKREWLDKGHERGLQANRPGDPFSLRLVNAHESDPDKRRGIIGTGRDATYYWWCGTDPTIGSEASLGPVERVDVYKALETYLGLIKQRGNGEEWLKRLGVREER